MGKINRVLKRLLAITIITVGHITTSMMSYERNYLMTFLMGMAFWICVGVFMEFRQWVIK